MIRSLLALSAVSLALVGLAACGSSVPSDAVVSVNGTAITKDAFNHWLGVAAASTATTPGAKPVLPDPPNYTACVAHFQAIAPKPAKGQKAPTTAQLRSECEQQYKSLQTEVLGFLISSSWVLGEAHSLGVKMTDAEVKKQFEKIKSQQFPKAAEFQKFLSTSGQTVSDLLLRVKLNLLSQKIQAKISKQKGAPTAAQIEKYYNENKSKYGVPEKRSVQIILTKTEAEANAAKKEIESGKSFASVAKAKSIDPTSKVHGGVLPAVTKGEEESALDKALFSAKTDVLGGPVKTPFGYYIYEVKSITPGTQQTLAQAKASIKQQLQSTGSQTALSTFVKNFKKKWTAKTICRSGYVVADCKTYVAPKTSTAPAGTSTAPAGTSTAPAGTATTPAG
jgi:parvulin-like peptidyl-prolyl isomerase